ncbi:hypothetical protein EGW08_013684 [Elysia chlorotica]|uniref:Uncharacterized protein n=1 Tax=Elysia chlorotica TaxID=188477 RepID=A0A3S1BDX2_ELYCH|nr:hypothetical protein EGW08_013684 [Elysia chlorotica]
MRAEMEAEVHENSSPRSQNDDNHYVKISSAQLSELLHSIDETKQILKSLCKPHYESEVSSPAPRRIKSWWGRHCWPSKRRFLYRNITMITVILQFLNLMMLTVIDVLPRHLVEEYKMLVASSATMITFEVANLIILILATGRLAKQVFRHSVNSFFLAQSYLATVLLFAGLYTLTYRLNKKSWKFMNEDLTSNPIQVFKLYLKFLFYSISTATLCGSDNALPVDWYNHLFAGTQMLLSFCYFASILGLTLSPTQLETKGTESENRHRRYPTQCRGSKRSTTRSLYPALDTNSHATEPDRSSSEDLISISADHQERQIQEEYNHGFGRNSNNFPDCNGV